MKKTEIKSISNGDFTDNCTKDALEIVGTVLRSCLLNIAHPLSFWSCWPWSSNWTWSTLQLKGNHLLKQASFSLDKCMVPYEQKPSREKKEILVEVGMIVISNTLFFTALINLFYLLMFPSKLKSNSSMKYRLIGSLSCRFTGHYAASSNGN